MFWAGRLNAITGLIAFAGLLIGVLFSLPSFVFGFSAFGLLNFGWILAFVVIICAVLMRAGFAVADMYYRSFYGKPLVYDQRVDTAAGQSAKVAE